MNKCLLGLAAFTAGWTAYTVDMPETYTHYGWIESDDVNEQWVNTEYTPTIDTVFTASFRLLERSEDWASILGAFNYHDQTGYGVVLRYHGSDQRLNGLFCNANNNHGEAQIDCSVGQDYVAELKAGGLTIGGTPAKITTVSGNLDNYSTPIYLFAECDAGSVRRHQKTRMYGVTIAKGETLMRDFRPCKNEAGQFGLWDVVEGKFYGNQGDKGDFTAGGLTYTKAAGAMVVSEGGRLTADDAKGVTSLTQEETVESLEAGVVSDLTSLTVKGGVFSLQDDKAATLAVSGTITLAGGVELKLDVTPTGVDAITAGTLNLDSVTAENPIKLTVRGVGAAGVPAAQAILTGANLTAEDSAKFTLTAEIPCELQIANGNLMLTPKAVPTAVWTRASGDWSAVENWQEGQKPSFGAPVTIAVPAEGGAANQDIDNLSIASLTIDKEAGSFTLSGNKLGIMEAIDDPATTAQTLRLPLELGMVGGTFPITAAGDLSLTGGADLLGNRTEVNAAENANVTLGAFAGTGTLAKSGAGTVTLAAASPNFTGSLEITGGKMVSHMAVPFPSAAAESEIRISNGGTLDLGGPYKRNTVNYKNRKVVISGAGVDDKGAIVADLTEGNDYEQYYAFSNLELLDDAAISAVSGRWDVQPLNGNGSIKLNGHTLTKLGAGRVVVANAPIEPGAATAKIDVQAGAFQCEVKTALSGTENELNIASEASFEFYKLSNPIEWTVTMADGATIFGRQENVSTPHRVTGTVNLTGGMANFDVFNDYNLTLEGPVTGEGGLKKRDSGYLYLKGAAKTYTGGTTVEKGRLYLADASQKPETGTITVSGDNAGLVLPRSGWSDEELNSILKTISLGTWNSYVGFDNDTENAPLTIDWPIAKDKGGLLFQASKSPVKMTNDLTLKDGMLVVSGDVELSGEGKVMTTKRVELTDVDTTLMVKEGATLKVTSADPNVGDIIIGSHGADNAAEQKMVVDHATVTVDPVPEYAQPSSTIKLATARNAVGILEVKEGGVVNHRILGASDTEGRSAIYIRKGGQVENYGGRANDGYISHNGYGYMENDGIYRMRGFSQVQNGNEQKAIGILYSTGDIVFSRGVGGQYDDGRFDVIRGGTGVVYQTSGKISVDGEIDLTSRDGEKRGAAYWTIDGAEAVTHAAKFVGANKDNTVSVLNLNNGGTLEYETLSAHEFSYINGAVNQPFYINADGGFLSPLKSGNLVREDERDGTKESFKPTRMTAFANGLGIDVGAGVQTTLNMPIRKPEDRGIKAITPEDKVFETEYIGAPFVRIEGDGYGASAVALYDSTTRRVTGVKVTSPGCGYTTATATLVCGKKTDNDDFTATVELTEDEQVCGGLIKRGAGRLKVSAEMLPDVTETSKAPLTVLGGILDLGGMTYYASELTLGEGARIDNGRVIADKVTTVGDARLTANITVADAGTVSVDDGRLTVDLRQAGLLMKLFSYTSRADVETALVKEDLGDWSDAVPVMSFNRANSQDGWSNFQILAYKGYLWNRSAAPVTWTFGEHFDDGTRVLIDGKVVLSDTAWNSVTIGQIVGLTPGPHTFEVRFAQFDGGAGTSSDATDHKETWPANTLAFGLNRKGSLSYDVTLYEHLEDISDGELFTLAEGERTFDTGSLDLSSGTGVSFEGANQAVVNYGHAITLDAADILAGRPLKFKNAAVTFAEGTTVTINNFDTFDLANTKATKFVLVEADALDGLENVTFVPPAPHGWDYRIEKGKRLTLVHPLGLQLIIR